MQSTTWRICLALSLAAGLALVSQAAAAEAVSAEEMALIKAAEARRVEVIERVYGAVVAIYGPDRQGGGSGVIFDPAGFALTNHHVIAGAGKEGFGGLSDGELYSWKLVGTDPGGDIAIIKLEGKEAFPAAPLGDSSQVRIGDWAMAMGNPFLLAEDQKPTVTLGIVSGVDRYQYGMGTNQLVYGECIQVDSSINPGNSGGPLFNMRGEIIGINGRGSFLERGRVNVGLGYAVSVNQIKKFIPDLLATKVAAHGTLDALFHNRTGGVICDTLNLDSPIANAGLVLGDRLVAFEGRPVTNANQFTNMISTLPADWPVTLDLARGDERFTASARLIGLPYARYKPAPPKPEEGDEPKEGGEPAPEQPPMEELDLTEPGVIGDMEANRKNCELILGRWRKSIGDSPEASKAIHIVDEVRRAGKIAGEQRMLLAADGRFRVEQALVGDDRPASIFAYDGESFWEQPAKGNARRLALDKALQEPILAQAAALATLFGERAPLAGFGQSHIDGGDKAGGEAAFRIKTIDEGGDWFYVWLSVPDRPGEPPMLRRAGASLDGREESPSIVYGDWRDVAGTRIPFRRALVTGIEEDVVMEMLTKECRLVEASDVAFELPE